MGVFYAILSGIMVLVQGPVLRKALQKFSEEKLVIIGSIILGTNFILFVSNENFLNLCRMQFCLQLGMDLCGPLSCQYSQSALGTFIKEQYKELQVVLEV